MNHFAWPGNLARALALAAAALAVAGSPAGAAPAHNVCVPNATGVPTRGGPPKWLDWSGTTTPADIALDDPRWLGSTGQSFELGSARAPLASRALWSNAGGKDYLYLSFIVDLEGFSSSSTTTPRDLFLGFRRPSPFAGAGGAENAYIFQFHLTGTTSGAASAVSRPAHCGQFSTCDESSGTPVDFWRVFVDRGATETCTSSSVTGEKFERFVDATDVSKPPISWMTAATPDQDAVRYWKLDATQPPLLQNRWAVQIRLPVAPDDTRSLEEGIPPGATFWYEGSMAVGGGGSPYAAIGWWPRELLQPVCPSTALQDYLVHPELGTPDKWSRISRLTGAPPADCDTGITIRHTNIGAVFDAGAGTDFAAVNPMTSFKATRPDGSVAANTVIAQPVNLGSTPVTAPILARFRLAEWGSAPWSTPTDTGKWKDMRGAESGVCMAGAPPACTAATVPALVDADHDGLPDPGTNNRGAITFQWTIGSDPTIGASEYCKFGLTPPGGTCSTGCSCAAPGAHCELTADPGIQATVGTTVSPCVSKNYTHQCMLVELSAPNGGVSFVQSSSWNNMNFDQMSSVAREALIDARQLPVGKGQLEQDIYLVAMARNMPRSLQGDTDGGLYIRERALERAEVIAQPYVGDIAKLSDAQIYEIAARYSRQAPPPIEISKTANLSGSMVERLKRVQRALLIMPPRDYNVTYRLLLIVASGARPADLTEAVVRAVGPAEAAGVVPTIDIYPFYRPLGAGVVYMPMTAFSVFLSHEGLMKGMTWAIDGATQVGQNIYRLQIPIGYARRIQVRAQAIETSDVLAPSNPRWPCAGVGCCPSKSCGLVGQLGNGLPGLLAGIYVVLRRRRRSAPTPASLP